jgi:Rrf2 family protein
MKFSTKIRYGVRAILEIAGTKGTDGIFQKDIAEKHHISFKYLDQIINSLKAAGLIVNVRGKKSGYRLTRKASEITILDVHNAFEHGICIVECISSSFRCELYETCLIREYWGGLNTIILEYLRKTTLQDILDGKKLVECTEAE